MSKWLSKRQALDIRNRFHVVSMWNDESTSFCETVWRRDIKNDIDSISSAKPLSSWSAIREVMRCTLYTAILRPHHRVASSPTRMRRAACF